MERLPRMLLCWLSLSASTIELRGWRSTDPGFITATASSIGHHTLYRSARKYAGELREMAVPS